MSKLMLEVMVNAKTELLKALFNRVLLQILNFLAKATSCISSDFPDRLNLRGTTIDQMFKEIEKAVKFY